MRSFLNALLAHAAREPVRLRVVDARGHGPAVEWTNAALVDAVAGVARALIEEDAGGGAVRAARPAAPVLVATGSGGAFWAAMLGVVAAGRDAVPMAASAPRGLRDRVQQIVRPARELDAHAVEHLRRDGAAAWLAERLADRSWECGGVILLSSGTTGRSRFVRRSPSALEWIARGLLQAGLFRADDVVGSFLPMHHAYGFEHAFLAPLLAGAAVRQGESFGTGEAFDLLAGGVTVLPLVPSAAAALAESPWPTHQLRQLITAGSPLRPSVRERLARVAKVMPVDLYGATELGTIWLDHGRGGEPVDGVEVRIADPSVRDAIRPMPDGAEGEIVIRSATRYDRLLSDSASDESDDHVEGWFRTADLGVCDGQGRYRVTCRLKLVFDVGGLKVNPYDVEAALEEHPAVRVALVEPIVVGHGLARVGATVELVAQEVTDPAELRRFLAERVPAHALPRSIQFVERLERTPSGKVLRSPPRSVEEPESIVVSCSPVESRPEELVDRSKREAWTQALFNGTARGYDMSSGAAFLGTGCWYRRRMLLQSGLRRGVSLLDVGSGTGLCAWLAQSIVGEEGRVVSLDPSPGMLSVARARGVRETMVGQAEHLPFADDSFDFVTMSYMLRHIEDLATAFKEARRVLRPCGRIVILEVTRPKRGLARHAFRLAMRHLVPVVGVVASGRPSTFPMIRYWADTIEVAARPSAIVAALEGAGFVGVRHLSELGVFSHYRGTVPS